MCDVNLWYFRHGKCSVSNPYSGSGFRLKSEIGWRCGCLEGGVLVYWLVSLPLGCPSRVQISTRGRGLSTVLSEGRQITLEYCTNTVIQKKPRPRVGLSDKKRKSIKPFSLPCLKSILFIKTAELLRNGRFWSYLLHWCIICLLARFTISALQKDIFRVLLLLNLVSTTWQEAHLIQLTTYRSSSVNTYWCLTCKS